MNDIPIEIKRVILDQKLQLWRNTVYDAQLDVKVAELLGDEQMKAQATERMRNALKAIDILEGLLNSEEE